MDAIDRDAIKKAIVTNVYHIDANKEVPMHKHNKHDEIFYCISGNGYGVLENERVELTPGKAFIVPSGTMHSLQTDDSLHAASFLIPALHIKS